MTPGLVSTIILNYNQCKYIDMCMQSVQAQDYIDQEIHFIDNNSSDGSAQYFAEKYPDIRLSHNQENVGYCKAINQGIRESRGEYIWLLNVDVTCQSNFLNELVCALNRDAKYASAQGKLYHLVNGERTNIIDTVGVRVTRSRRNFDRGQAQVDNGQFNEIEEIFGADGSASLFRRQALEDIAFEGEYLDEDFFMYREVVDLAWRLQYRGYRSVFTPRAVGWHVRRFSPKTRKEQSAFIKKLSYRNRLLTIYKNDTLGCYLRDSYRIVPFEIAMLGHILLREQGLLKGLIEFFDLYPRFKRKRKYVHNSKTILNNEIMQYFE